MTMPRSKVSRTLAKARIPMRERRDHALLQRIVAQTATRHVNGAWAWPVRKAVHRRSANGSNVNIEVISFVAAETGYLEGTGQSEITAMDGNRGFMILTHRASAATTTVSYWVDSPSLAAGQERLARIHRGPVGGERPVLNIEHFDLAVSRRLRAPGSTAIALMTRLVCCPAGISRTIAFYRTDVFAALQASGGLCSAELFLAGLTGNGSALTIWDNDDHATAAWRLFHQLAARAADTFGIEYFGLQVFDSVLGPSPSETAEW